MAPYKKITKKEADLQQRPWITKGLLISMNKRDSLYKEFANEINPDNKEKLGSLYKKYRNLIVSLLRMSKKKHYADYFEEHKTNIKKTWDGIRDLLNVSKKTSININKVIHDNKVISDNKGIAQSMNNFFVNIGTSVEAKIPNAKTSFQSYLGENVKTTTTNSL